MIERVARPPGRATASTRPSCRSATGPTPSLDAYPDGRCAGVRLHLRRRARAARHRRRHRASRPADGGIDDTVRGGQRRRAHRPRPHRPGRLPPPTRAPRPPSPSRRSTTRPASAWSRPTRDGRVVAFIEKPPPGEAPTNLINAGTYVLEPSVLDRIPPGRRVSIERETFPALVADGHALRAGVRRLLARRRHARPPTSAANLALAGQPRSAWWRSMPTARRRSGRAPVDGLGDRAGVVVEAGRGDRGVRRPAGCADRPCDAVVRRLGRRAPRRRSARAPGVGRRSPCSATGAEVDARRGPLRAAPACPS